VEPRQVTGNAIFVGGWGENARVGKRLVEAVAPPVPYLDKAAYTKERREEKSARHSQVLLGDEGR